MQCQNGTLVSDITGKLQVILDYYKTLYMAEPATDQEISDFLASAAILKVKEEDRISLDTPIKLSEVYVNIKGLKFSKAPSFDGLTIEFYKKKISNY